MAPVVKNPLAGSGDPRDGVSIPGSERSSGVGSGNPLQHSCQKIPRTEEPGRLQSMGSQRVGHDWVCAHACAHTHIHTQELVADMFHSWWSNRWSSALLLVKDEDLGRWLLSGFGDVLIGSMIEWCHTCAGSSQRRGTSLGIYWSVSSPSIVKTRTKMSPGWAEGSLLSVHQ